MSHRVADQVWWARPCERPRSIPVSRPRGAKAKGLTYERGLGSVLPGAVPSQWWEFRDRNGPGWCQSDWLVPEFEHTALVLECKYTWTPAGHTQIEQLYRPVIERALGRPVIGMVVCKVLLPETPQVWICPDLASALTRARSGLPVVWHWLGAVALSPRSKARRAAHHTRLDPSALGL